MPGPMSAPNGDRSLLDPAVRKALRQAGTLRTGKTATKRPAEQPRRQR